MNSHRIFQKSRLRRVRALLQPYMAHGSKKIHHRGKRAPRITLDSFFGLSGLCARLARARFGGEPSSGSLARREVDCEWRMGGSSPPLRGQVLARSLAHGCVATSEVITAAMRMYLFCSM